MSYDSIMSAINSLPNWALAFIGAWIITQTLKFALPIEWASDIRSLMTRLIAFTSATILMIFIAGTASKIVVLGMFVGLATPLASAVISKTANHFWPWLGDILSGDVRGSIVGEKKENR